MTYGGNQYIYARIGVDTMEFIELQYSSLGHS